jgi:hypothetical protein
VLLVGQVLRPRHPAGVGAEQGEQAALECALVQLDVHAELEAPDHVEELLERRALGVDPQLRAGVQHAQVPEHLALVGEERGVAAVPRLERLDVVRDLAVEEGLRLGPGERELAAFGAVGERACLARGAVLGGELIGDGHPLG